MLDGPFGPFKQTSHRILVIVFQNSIINVFFFHKSIGVDIRENVDRVANTADNILIISTNYIFFAKFYNF